MLGFMGFRNSVSHRVAEFRWPMGRELSSSVRRMTMSEFCIALELAADLVDSMRGQLRGDDSSVYIKELDVQRELYENKLRKMSEENEAQLALMEEKYAIVNDDNLRMKTVLNGTSGTMDITVDKLDEQRCMLEGQALLLEGHARSLENLTSTLSILGNKNNSDNSASLHSLETKVSELIKKVDTLFVKPNEQTPIQAIKEETVEITPEEKVVEVKVSKKNKWQLHVEEIQRANNIPLKEAMVLAKETYKKDN
jgi:hypothetical protein